MELSRSYHNRTKNQVETVAMTNKILAMEVVQVDIRGWCLLYAEAGWLTVILFDAENDFQLSLDDIRSWKDTQVSTSTSEHTTIWAFSESSIHGISLASNQRTDEGSFSRSEWECPVCVFGDHSLRLISLIYRKENTTERNRHILRAVCDEKLTDDLIVAVKFLQHGLVGALLSHNTVHIFSSDKLDMISKMTCTDSSILYSGLLLGDAENNLIAIGGTVCNYLCFWIPLKSLTGVSAFAKLKGHEGVIFSINYNHSQRILCSTSDDRSCRIYHCSFPDDTTRTANNCPSVEQWTKASFVLVYALYGHEARVWRGLIFTKFFLTVGEDTNCCIWSRDGKLIERWSSHTGINTWSAAAVEVNDRALIFTGGANGGISARAVPLGNRPLSQSWLSSSSPPTGQMVRRLAIVSDTQFLVQVDDGHLYVVTVCDPVVWTLFWDDKDIKQCVALQYNDQDRCAVMVTCTGKLALIRSTLPLSCPSWTLDLNSNCMEALWTGTKSLLLVSGPSGFIHIVSATGDYMTVQGTVPVSGKNLWITAVIQHDDLIFCGDRSGSLRVLSRIPSEGWKDIYVDPHVHGQHEVSQISLQTGETDDTHRYLFTSGRSGTVIFWRYVLESPDRIRFYRLRVFEPDKTVVEWISGFHLPNQLHHFEHQLLIFGFRSTKFAGLHWASQTAVLDVDCGGGHRSYSVRRFHEKDIFRFAFVKTNGIHWIDSAISEYGRQSVEIKSALHGLPIWCIEHFPGSVDSGSLIFATGSEDTSIKIVKIQLNGGSTVDPSVVAACRGHLSSVRVVRSSLKFKNCFYSAGGRTQISCWQCPDADWSKNVILTSQWTPFPVVRKKWSDQSLLDPDTRIMDLGVCLRDNYEVVAAGSSDGLIRVFALGSPNEITLLGEIVQFSWCVLHVRLLVWAGELLLIAAGTKGVLDFKTVTNFVTEKLKSLDDYGEVDSSGRPSLATVSAAQCHQAGIDALDLWTEGSDAKMMVATGGDDSALTIVCFNDLTLLETFSRPNAHCAQITGVQLLLRKKLLTGGKDQLIKIWEVDYDRKKVELLSSVTTDVSDLSYMTSLTVRERREPHTDGDNKLTFVSETYVALAGAGFQLLNISAWLTEI